MGEKRNWTCGECGAPTNKEGLYEGQVLGNLDDITNQDRVMVMEWLVTMAAYCSLKNQASAAQERGAVTSAQRMERLADRLFRELPKFLRW